MPDNLKNRIRELSSPLAPLPTDAAPKLARLPVRAVLFDVYGTLLVSGSGDVGTAMQTDNASALFGALSSMGIGCVKAGAERAVQIFFSEIRDAHARLLARRDEPPEVDIREIWRRTFGKLKEEGIVERVLGDDDAARFSVEYECRANPVWPMPEAAETLAALRERGVALGIVSNAQFFTPLTMEALFGESLAGLGFHRELCAWSWKEGVAKPSAALFGPPLRRLRDGFGIAPAQTVFVGNDMRNDILAASRCGCRTCLFAGDRRSLRLRRDDPECVGLQPDAIVARLSQMLSVVEGI